MQPYQLGFTVLVTLLATVSNPLTLSSAAITAFPPLIQAENSRQAQANHLFQQGIEQYKNGQREAAIVSWQQALSIYQELQDYQNEEVVLRNLSTAYLALANYTKAVEFLEPLLATTKTTGNRQGEAQALGNLGIAYQRLGEYNQAIASHQQALLIMRELKNRSGEGQVLGNLGYAYEALGDYDKAIASYQESLTIARELNNRQGVAIALGNLGAIYATLGDYNKAVEHYEQSLAIAKEVGDKEGEGYSLKNIGSAFHAQGNPQKALDYYQQSLVIAKAIGNRQLEGEILTNLGIVYEDLRDYNKAITHHEQSLAIAQTSGNPRLEALALNNLGHALFNSGKLKEAENKLREAVNLFESLRPGLTDADNVSIFDTQVLTYNLLQQILIAQTNYKAALEIAERGRARAFVELLARRLSPETALASVSKPPTIEQIQQIAQTQQATLVEYSIVPDDEFKFQGKQRGEASELLIWVVQPTGEVTFRRVDLKFLQQQEQVQGTTSTALETLVTTSRILQGPRIRQGEAARKQLHQLLIEPIAEFLPKNPEARVIFIPQESLFLLPFPALQNASGQYLIEKHTILTAPAIQVLDLTHQQRQRLQAQDAKPLQGEQVLIVGNPTMPTLKIGETVEQLAPLPDAEAEAKAIAALLHTQAVIGDNAKKVDIVKRMPEARLIHLATHGLLDDIRQLGVPGAIALAPSANDDGFLTASELFNITLKAELVVLSGCHTGRGKITGDGVVGLSRSLISAGVPSVIVSLWAVPDASTALLMSEFYRHLSTHLDKATALRQAMLTTMQRYPDPINWAAFTLIGEAD